MKAKERRSLTDLSENLKEILANFFTAAKEHFQGFAHGIKRQNLGSAVKEVLDGQRPHN
ncbi:MAG: hypothetical protein QGH66_06965 [Dehalococcoidia bacterium]|nr:hypothetical protein [Dehalococcoidia bacterium]MDP7470289.1 hypothetical protein [Dehalococcoidia bacterium]